MDLDGNLSSKNPWFPVDFHRFSLENHSNDPQVEPVVSDIAEIHYRFTSGRHHEAALGTVNCGFFSAFFGGCTWESWSPRFLDQH